jgi:hypothetical protein
MKALRGSLDRVGYHRQECRAGRSLRAAPALKQTDIIVFRPIGDVAQHR